jgi:hypothetical protein
MVLSASTQAEERKDGEDDDNEADKVNDAVHFGEAP